MTGSVSYHEGVAVPARPRRAKVRSDSYRNRVLRCVKQASEPMTMEEIAAELRCATITVRRQLKALCTDRVVRCAGRRRRISQEGLVLPARGPNLYTLA